MHSAPMPDSVGVFDEWKATDRLCRECGSKTVRYRIWESSCGGYEDLNFECNTCGKIWWVDGCDS